MAQDIQQRISQLLTLANFLSKQDAQPEQAIAVVFQACTLASQYFGEEHPVYARCLNDIGMLYQSMKDYAKAEQSFFKALTIRRKLYGETHPDTAQSLNNLGVLYLAIGNFSAAEEQLRRALDIYRMAGKEMSLVFAGILGNLAEACLAKGNYSEAETHYLNALQLKHSLIGRYHIETLPTLDKLVELYKAIGNDAAAESFFQQGQVIRRIIQAAQNMNMIAEQYRLKGDYDAAKPLYLQSLTARRNLYGENHPRIATVLDNLGLLYQAKGDYRESLRLHLQALDIFRSTLGNAHLDVAICLNNLAGVYTAINDYTTAEAFYRRVLEIYERIGRKRSVDAARTLNNLGAMYQRQEKYSEAEPLLQEALEIFRLTVKDTDQDMLMCQNNLATLYFETGKETEAERLQLQVLEAQRKALGEVHPDIAQSLNNLAAIYFNRGDYAQAEPLHWQAHDLWCKTLGETHPKVATSLNNLAQLYMATSRQMKALEFLKQATAIDDQLIELVLTAGSERQAMSFLSSVQTHFEDFLFLVLQHASNSPEEIQSAFDLVLRRKAITIEAYAARREAILSGQYPALATKLKELTALRLQIGEKTLAGPVLGLDGLQIHREELAEAMGRKEQLESELALQAPEIILTQQLRKVRREAVSTALPEGTVLVEFIRFSSDYRITSADQPSQIVFAPYIAFVMLAGEPDTVQLINLGKAEDIDQMIATFRSSITDRAEVRGLQEEVLQVVDETVTRHIKPTTPQHSISISDGQQLRATIFDPLLPALQGRTHIFIAADGNLNNLPFEVLPTAGEHYLIDDYSFSYLSAGRDVLRFNVASTIQPTSPLVVADPDFNLSEELSASRVKETPIEQVPDLVFESILAKIPDLDLDRSVTVADLDFNPSGELLSVSRLAKASNEQVPGGKTPLHFEPLPGTRVEGQQIATMLGIQPLLAEKALESEIKGYHSPIIFHIATHGFALEHFHSLVLNLFTIAAKANTGFIRLMGPSLQNPLLRSGLALSGANTWLRGGTPPPEAEDGLLTAEDVSALDLSATELVVLSACETGLGDVQLSEGVFGLRRAFVLAGARTMVLSLWKVPDQQTQQLMREFYRLLLEGSPSSKALRTAQLALKEKYPHPFYWGAFICQGDPRALPGLEHLQELSVGKV